MARARSVISNVLYTHPEPFDEASQRYPCCHGLRTAKGCHMRSLRGPDDLTQAQISIQFALSTLVSLTNASMAAWGSEAAAEQQIEALRVQCRALWEDYEKQKKVEEAQREAQRATGKPSEDAQKLLERRREEELRVEREKREQQQRIERIAEEEKERFRHVLERINEVEIVQDEKHPRTRRQAKTKTKTKTRHGESAKKNGLEESSEDESDENTQINEDNLMEVFGDLSDSDSESEAEAKANGKANGKAKSKTNAIEDSENDENEARKEVPKKRIRAVESSEDDEPTPEEKRTHLEEIQQELNNVFSDEDWGVRSNKLRFFTFRQTGTAARHQHQHQNDHHHEDRDEHDVARVLPPHLVLQSSRVRIKDECLLVQVPRLVRQFFDLLSTTEHLV